MSSHPRLPLLLVLAGVLGSVLAVAHSLTTASAEQDARIRAQVEVVARLAATRLQLPVLRGSAEGSREVIAELLAPAPATAARVFGLDGTVLASWTRGEDPEQANATPADVGQGRGDMPSYTIRTGRRPIGQLVIVPEMAELEIRPLDLLIPAGLPLLIGLFGCLVLNRERGGGARGSAVERVAALEEELEQARSALDSASRAKSLFLANMSHEIRTPLNGVLGMADLLLGTSLDERQYKFADTVRGSAESLLNIVNDLLDFSRVESGSLHLDVLDFCPQECVEDVVQLLGSQAHTKGIELVCEIVDELPRLVRGDPARLRQVLVNLVGNAVKFTERGEVVVRVGATPRENEKVRFNIEVSDTGIGIPRDLQGRIFDSFVQLDASTTRRYGGAGLGLAISRHLVELMNGTITLDSEPGKGTTFSVELLLEPVADASSRGVEATAALEGARVLIVDDNDTNRLVLSNQLESWNIDHTMVPSGSQALALLRSAAEDGNPFSIAILDMQMPGMDGITLAGHIKADRSLQELRLMLLTSAVIDLTPEELGEAGFAQFTSKPVRQSQLYNCLVQLATSSPVPLDAAPRTGAKAPTPPTDKFNARVLLVEDNAINQEVASHMLESMGCEVEVAENGQAALDRLEKMTVDLVLMDCQMPVMDGFEATEALRERERLAGSTTPYPIIALTANALAGDREQCLAAGMDDYVSKPFKLQELERLLARWLPGNTQGEAAEEVTPPSPAASPAEPAAGVLDEARLDFLRSIQRPGSPDLVAKVIRLYLDRTPDFLDSITEAVTEGDARSLQTNAHSLKSSSANLGALQMSEAARQLEQFGRENDMTRAPELLAVLRHAYPPVKAALERHLPADKPGHEQGVAG